MDKIQTIEKLFYYIVCYSYLLIPLSVILFYTYYKRITSTLIIFFLYGLVFFFFLFFYYDIPREFRKLFQSLYTFMEYSFFALLLWHDIKRKFFRAAIITLSLAFILFLIIYYFKSTLIRLDSVPIGIETFLIFSFIVFFFIEFLNNETPINFYYHYGFWVSVGILIYLGGSFFFYILINHLSNDQVSTFGNLTYLAEIIKNILFVIAVLVLRKKLPSINKKSDTIPFLDTI